MNMEVLERSRSRLCILLLCIATVVGCSSQDDERGSAYGASCATVNATQACGCGNQFSGRQVCTGGGWSMCECDGAGGGSLTGSGGTAAPGVLDHSGDPLGNARSDINFDWERKEGPEGPCEPGVYVGPYTCDYVMMGAQPPGLAVAGTVTITLARSEADGELLLVEDGELAGDAFFLIAFTSKLEGELTCANDTFHADAIDGMISVGGVFEGQLDGTLNRATSTLSGDWSLTVYDMAGGMENGTCIGTWTAVLQP